MNDRLKIRRRDDLNPLDRAVSDTLDEYLSRMQGIIASSWVHPVEFIYWLEERGYTIKRIDDKEETEV